MTEERQTRTAIQASYDRLDDVYPHTLSEEDWQAYVRALEALGSISFVTDE